MAPSLYISTGDPASPRQLGPIARILVGLVVIAVLVLALIVAIPLLIGIVIVGVIAISIARWRLRRRLRSEMTRGRENVRVIRRD